MNEMNEFAAHGIPDDLFVRDNVPMTKEEIRSIAVSKLRLKKTSKVIDIGAGTGSLSIELALRIPCSAVYAVEKNEEAVKLIERNIVKFNAPNIKVIRGSAPEALHGISGFDRVFIGGSGGKIDEIMQWVNDNIKENGIIVVNALTLETLFRVNEFFKNKDYAVEIVQVSISKCGPIGKLSMLKPQNPVFIITARKGEE